MNTRAHYELAEKARVAVEDGRTQDALVALDDLLKRHAATTYEESEPLERERYDRLISIPLRSKDTCDVSPATWFVIVTFAGASRGDEWVKWKDADTADWAIVRGCSNRNEAANRVLDTLDSQRFASVRTVQVARISDLETITL
jgi:hypothetical protein